MFHGVLVFWAICLKVDSFCWLLHFCLIYVSSVYHVCVRRFVVACLMLCAVCCLFHVLLCVVCCVLCVIFLLFVVRVVFACLRVLLCVVFLCF